MATTAETMVEALTTALATGACIVSVTLDGTSYQFDRAQALKELALWERRLGRERGTRPTAAQVKLSGF